MKHTVTKAVVIAVAAAMLLFGCRDIFHSPEFDPASATYERDGVIRTVIFNANGGNGTAPSPQKAQSGETITIPSAGGLSRANRSFGGWNTSYAGTGVNYTVGSSFTMPNQDVTLYARWDGSDPVPGSGGGGTAPNPIPLEDSTFPYRDVAGGVEITGYNGQTKDVTIPAQLGGKAVVSIASEVFQNKQLVSVTIPNSVITIGSVAFHQNLLTNIIIPNS